MQLANSPIAEEIHFFHNDILLPIITVISLFVLGCWSMSSGNSTRRPIPTPSRTTHHTLLEVAWTIIPVMILVVHRHSLLPPARPISW